MEWKFLDYPLTQRYPATPIKPINLLEPGGGGRKRRNSSSKAAVGRVRGNRCFGVSRPISPKWNERGWAIVEADPRRVYIYICLPCHSSRRCVFTPASSFFAPRRNCQRSKQAPCSRTRARARDFWRPRFTMGSARAPLSRKALLQTPLSRTGREGLKLVMTHLGQITTRVATRVATPRTISSNPFTINIRYVDFKLEKLLKKKKRN